MYRYAALDHSDEKEVERMLRDTNISHRLDLRSPFEIMKSKFTKPPVRKTFMAKRFTNTQSREQDAKVTLASAITAQMRPTDVFRLNRERKKKREEIVLHQTSYKGDQKIEMFNVNFINMRYVDNSVWDKCTQQEKWRMIWYMLTFRFNNVLQFVSNKLGQGGLAGSYEGFIDHSVDAISSALKILTTTIAENGVVGVNCMHGKDRTGIVIAFAKYIVGDDEEDIFDDYATSEALLAPWMEYMVQEFTKQGLPAEFAKTPRQVMETTFAYIRQKYGSIEAYLDSIGFDESWRAKLQALKTS